MADAAISVEGVSKQFRLYTESTRSIKEQFTRRKTGRYNEFWALQDVDLTVERGEVFGFVGHNGSGKSTLLRCIAGIYRPTKGRVATNGRISALLELGAGFHPELTGRENIFMNATILGFSRSEIEPLVPKIAEFTGLGEFLDVPVKVYSSGMFVRLGFAVAVNVQPEILIIDEVIAVGDEEFQRKCFEHLYQLRKQGVTIVMVSHGLGLIQTMCDRAMWLERGKVQSIGPALEVVEDYIHKVNRDETQSDVAAPTGGMAEYGRQGSGEIAVTSVQFLDRTGDQVGFLPSRDPLTIRMFYRASEPVESPAFAISVHSDAGFHLTGQWCGEDFGRVSGEGYVDFHIDDMRLMPGDWEVSTSIYDRNRGHVFDRLERAFHLTIRPNGDSDAFGHVKTIGEWSIHRGAS
ncbi:MAG TPA: ABC transporter ATP-binding protein [Microthrixaceae bacterium]|nr:ABC transporter ATP-binding protein [Microthrixaceae bacterium]